MEQNQKSIFPVLHAELRYAEKRKAYRMRLKNILIVVKDIEESNKYLNVEVSSRAGHNRKSDRKR